MEAQKMRKKVYGVGILGRTRMRGDWRKWLWDEFLVAY